MRVHATEDYPWTSSSAAYGFRTSGTLAAYGPRELVFHTELERNPWVVIDLPEARPVHWLEVRNRSDCCQDRAVPLTVEVAGDDQQFATVAEQRTPFRVWQVAFAPRRARQVRLRVEGTAYFHLEGITIR
jgi:hypothetical protein